MFTCPEKTNKIGHVIYIEPDLMKEWKEKGFGLGSQVLHNGQTLKVISVCPFPTLGDKTGQWKFGTVE